ncbi:hypothetical protein PMAYCL1PPCAC_26446, partial [Pristionchus mayeri]
NIFYQNAPITVEDGEDREVKREAEEEVHPVVPVVEPTARNVQKLIIISGEKQSRIENLGERVKCLGNVIDQNHYVLKEEKTEELEKK